MIGLYVYRASLVNIVDADTFDFHVDLGLYSRYSSRFRLNGWDCPELRKGSIAERDAAKVATAVTQAWFASVDDQPYIRTHKADSFGRWLVDVFHPDVTDLGSHLANEGLATEWPQRWREVYDN